MAKPEPCRGHQRSTCAGPPLGAGSIRGMISIRFDKNGQDFKARESQFPNPHLNLGLQPTKIWFCLLEWTARWARARVLHALWLE